MHRVEHLIVDPGANIMMCLHVDDKGIREFFDADAVRR